MRYNPFLFALLLQASLLWGQELPFANSEFVTVNGVKLHYRIWEPQGSENKGNILLLHGFVSSTYTWRNNCDFFAERGFRVVTLDLPAFGYSDGPKRFDHSPGNLSQLVWNFLDTIGGNAKWHIVGHSTSGSIVTAMAMAEPERLNTTTIVDGIIQDIISSSFYDAVSGTMEVAVAREIMSFLASRLLFNEDVFTDFLTLAYFKKPSPEVVQGYIKPYGDNKSRRRAFDLFRMKRQISTDEFYEKLPELQLIWGQRDPWIPVAVAKRIQRRTGKGSLYIIPKAGHTPMETHAEEFNKVLLEIINPSKPSQKGDL